MIVLFLQNIGLPRLDWFRCDCGVIRVWFRSAIRVFCRFAGSFRVFFKPSTAACYCLVACYCFRSAIRVPLCGYLLVCNLFTLLFSAVVALGCSLFALLFLLLVRCGWYAAT